MTTKRNLQVASSCDTIRNKKKKEKQAIWGEGGLVSRDQLGRDSFQRKKKMGEEGWISVRHWGKRVGSVSIVCRPTDSLFRYYPVHVICLQDCLEGLRGQRASLLFNVGKESTG